MQAKSLRPGGMAPFLIQSKPGKNLKKEMDIIVYPGKKKTQTTNQNQKPNQNHQYLLHLLYM